MRRDYCVYVLCDPRKPGDYQYGAWYFPEKPFYVGQGGIHRPYEHLEEAKGSRSNYKLNKIRAITSEYDSYAVTVIGTELTRKQALALEIQLIAQIGRADLKVGPLTNLTNGGDGGRGMLSTPVTRRRRSEATRRMHATRSTSQKRLVYAKVSASHKARRAAMTERERRAAVAANIKGKQESIKRIHQGYLRTLTQTLSGVFEYKTYSELRELLPSIPKRTLVNLLKEYTRDGLMLTHQEGANRPKRYLYIL